MKTLKNVLFLFMTAIIAVSLVNCNGDDDDDPTPVNEDEVIMDNTAFSPSTLTVSEGTTVTWTNMDDIDHTTTSGDGLWNSGVMASGETFSYTFDETGTFDYVCTLHPNMTGQIIVE